MRTTTADPRRVEIPTPNLDRLHDLCLRTGARHAVSAATGRDALTAAPLRFTTADIDLTLVETPEHTERRPAVVDVSSAAPRWRAYADGSSASVPPTVSSGVHGDHQWLAIQGPRDGVARAVLAWVPTLRRHVGCELWPLTPLVPPETAAMVGKPLGEPVSAVVTRGARRSATPGAVGDLSPIYFDGTPPRMTGYDGLVARRRSVGHVVVEGDAR